MKKINSVEIILYVEDQKRSAGFYSNSFLPNLKKIFIPEFRIGFKNC